MDKTLAQLSQPQTVPHAASEAHYTGTLVPLARELFMSDPRRVAYVTIKVDREYRPGVGWVDGPGAWRFTSALQHQADTSAAIADTDTTAIPSHMLEQIAAETPRCCRDLRRWQVDELPVLDPHPESPAATTVLARVDRRPGRPVAEGHAAVRRLLDLLATEADGRLTRLVGNLVRSESETAPIDEPGQVYTGRLLAEPGCAGLLEVGGDDLDDVTSMLRTGPVCALLTDPQFEVGTYLVTPTVQFDRRA